MYFNKFAWKNWNSYAFTSDLCAKRFCWCPRPRITPRHAIFTFLCTRLVKCALQQVWIMIYRKHEFSLLVGKIKPRRKQKLVRVQSHSLTQPIRVIFFIFLIRFSWFFRGRQIVAYVFAQVEIICADGFAFN